MNTLAYSTQKPEDVAAKVIELIKAETGETPTVTVSEGNASPTTAKTVAVEGLDLLFGGRKATNLFTLDFTLTTPRAMELSIPMNRQGVGVHAGGLMFVTNLRTSVSQAVSLKPPKFMSGAKFEGDPAVADKLNGNASLMKALKDFFRPKGNLGGVEIEIPAVFRIVPDSSGVILIALNMPKMLKMGFAVDMEIKQFASIADMIEATIS